MDAKKVLELETFLSKGTYPNGTDKALTVLTKHVNETSDDLQHHLR